MKNLTDIFTQNVFKTEVDFKQGQPVPMAHIDNFLPKDVALALFHESQSIPDEHWTEFTRKGSHMKECKKLEHAPIAHNLVSYLHSGAALKWLEEVTGIEGIIPDPHLVGAGYCKSFAGDTLKMHTDFNWNDSLKLHRAMSLIIYLNPEWNPEWGGALDFYDDKGEAVVKSNPCLFNRCLIWQYDKYGYHGYETPLSNPPSSPRTAFRLFYYTSSSQYDPADPPHRSLYWIDKSTYQPYDIRDHK